MLSLCPRGVLRGYSLSSRTLSGQVQHTCVGIALTRSLAWVSYDLDDGRADVDTRVFCCVVKERYRTIKTYLYDTEKFTHQAY